MPRMRKTQEQALEAVSDAMRSLAEANVFLRRAQPKLDGEASELSRSMSQQLHFLIGVAELLSYEIRKAADGERRGAKLIVVANQSAEAAGITPLSFLPAPPEKKAG